MRKVSGQDIQKQFQDWRNIVEKLELSALLAETKGKSYFMYVKFIDGEKCKISCFFFFPLRKAKQEFVWKQNLL